MTKRERIARMLRNLEHHREAKSLAKESGFAQVKFGHVEVYISEKFGGTILEVRVNWSSIGTVGPKETWQMALDLQHAAGLADMVQFIIDGKDDVE